VQPGGHLRECERLGHVVVSARVEACEPVDESVPGGQKQDWCLHAPCAQRLAKIAAVRIGKPDVDHERVGRSEVDLGQQFGAVRDGVDAKPVLLQPALQHATELRVVLDDHDSKTGHSSRSIAPSGKRLTVCQAMTEATSAPRVAAPASAAK